MSLTDRNSHHTHGRLLSLTLITLAFLTTACQSTNPISQSLDHRLSNLRATTATILSPSNAARRLANLRTTTTTIALRQLRFQGMHPNPDLQLGLWGSTLSKIRF